MKKLIAQIRDMRLVVVVVIIALLLIAFPKVFTGIAPVLLGVGLIAYSVLNFFVLRRFPQLVKYPGMGKPNAGRAFVCVVLGGAILAQTGEAIGPLGSIWAMLSLLVVSSEINEMVEAGRPDWFSILMVLVSTVLAIFLLFDPVEHFALHVRVLGLEIIIAVIQRLHKVEGGEAQE